MEQEWIWERGKVWDIRSEGVDEGGTAGRINFKKELHICVIYVKYICKLCNILFGECKHCPI